MVTARTSILACLFLASGAAAAAAENSDVRILNFPPVQKVEGTVEIEGHVDSAEALSYEKLTIQPAPLDNPALMVDLGILETAGFRSVVVSIAGQFPKIYASGQVVGVLLVPEKPLFLESLRERGRSLLSLQIEAALDRATSPDFAGSSRFDVAFPRYRVFLFNTGDVSVKANVYFYLTD